ncbi:MAG: M50 family metallopeptidase, partial [Sphingomonas sp.]
MPSSLAVQDQRQRLALLAGIAIASVLSWQTTLGSLILYPFTILATWFHEMGHGIAAMLAGRGFERLIIFADGSGFAESWRPA